MSTSVMGVILIVIGIVALASGVAGGIAKMLLEIKEQARGEPEAFGGVGSPTAVLEALTKFLEALVKAPIWLALVIIGIFLIAWGGTML